ncbi:Hypothetical protein CINCED_3A000204 [Cinara cedri]|uniref:Uncharacterized protein n=1 Tax=Cinara cedri TaxID=506608 RepID=A0A5E4N4H1_9HEMI|nr:Hypothetical protein CINCED_3A000204 [Cinara cedri]
MSNIDVVHIEIEYLIPVGISNSVHVIDEIVGNILSLAVDMSINKIYPTRMEIIDEAFREVLSIIKKGDHQETFLKFILFNLYEYKSIQQFIHFNLNYCKYKINSQHIKFFEVCD